METLSKLKNEGLGTMTHPSHPNTQDSQNSQNSQNSRRKAALDYHQFPIPGKVAIQITKPTESQNDLALAYSPGVAEPVRAIAKNPEDVYRYTAKGNLVGIITDGSAILGLGNLGPLASKPVMEGKAVLFKRFANIDVFDIEVSAANPQAFIETVANIAPTFGGINLEDIKGPECFEIEEALIARLNIPIFHDDQHGTAVVVGAALLNALELQNKDISQVKIVCLGAGAAGIASMRLLLSLGARRDNLVMVDRQGVIHVGRSDLNPYKFAFALETEERTLSDALKGADVFIGVSGPDLLSTEMLNSMAEKPIIFALSNPDPEINPELAHRTRSDIILATGRSDYPNQVNNVLCFPYLFRGALDVRARRINQEMLIAAVHAIREIAKEPIPESVLKAYNGSTSNGATAADSSGSTIANGSTAANINGSPAANKSNIYNKNLAFGPDYILPTPLDPRLIERVPPAVSKAAIQSGVAEE